MIKIIFIIYVILFFGFVFYLGQALNKKPHIIIILGDDMGWNDVGFHGSNEIKTPNIDALGYNGIILNNHYTLPTCTPSRAALLTGKYPIRTGFQGIPMSAGENRTLPANVPTMAEHMKNLGYKTHLVGKWHLGSAYKNCTPTQRGFDTHFGYWNGYIGYHNYIAANPGGFEGFDMKDGFEPVWSVSGKYSTDIFTQKAESVIKNHDTNGPLFLFLSHLASHTGWDGVELAVQNETKVHEEFKHIKSKRRRNYAGIMKSFDKSVGKVVTALSKKNMLDNSIILVFSDNGAPTAGMFENTGSNWPLRGIKGTFADGGVKTFSVIWSNYFKKHGIVSNELIHITDWLPTFYKAGGGKLKSLGEIDGINQWDTLVNNKKTKRTEILLNIDEAVETSGIIGINGTYKLIKVKTEDPLYGQFGTSGRSSNYPPYDIQSVLDSEVNKASRSIFTKYLTKTEILRLRNLADIGNCRNSQQSDIDFSIALFNIKNDPCETRNLIKDAPKIYDYLNRKLMAFYKVLVPQQNTKIDPCANPKFYNNTWSTWLSNPSSLCHVF